MMMGRCHSNNHKSSVIVIDFDSTNCPGDCNLKSTFATHMDYPLYKSWSGKPYPPQLQIYSLLNMCWYAACIITSITGQVRGQSHTSFLLRDRRALCLPQSHYQVLLGFQIKSHHPFSTATHCPPPQRSKYIRNDAWRNLKNNGSSERMSSRWTLTISLVT